MRGDVRGEGFRQIEEQFLSQRSQQVDPVEINSTAQCRRIVFVGEPFAGVKATKRLIRKTRMAVNGSGKEVLARSRFAFNDSEMDARGSDSGLNQEALKGRTDSDKVAGFERHGICRRIDPRGVHERTTEGGL